MTADFVADIDVQKFFLLTGLALVAMLAVGIAPTLALAGSAALLPMLIGCAIAWAGSIAGAMALKLVAARGPFSATDAAFLAAALRLAAVVALAAALVVSGRFDVRPLLLWTVFGHLGLLIVDTVWAVRALRPVSGQGVAIDE